jgi:hypothetical protein
MTIANENKKRGEGAKKRKVETHSISSGGLRFVQPVKAETKECEEPTEANPNMNVEGPMSDAA